MSLKISNHIFKFIQTVTFCFMLTMVPLTATAQNYYFRPPQSYGNTTFLKDQTGNYAERVQSYGRQQFFYNKDGQLIGRSESYGKAPGR